MRLGIIAVTRGGRALAERISEALPGAEILAGEDVAGKLADNWSRFDGFICIMAAGIAVRAMAPLLADKRTDPCVVVLDEKGRHVVSLLSGHLGGGNDLAARVAALTGGQAVITTASDTLGLVALDVWAGEQDLAATGEDMIRASADLVNRGSLSVYADITVDSLPPGLDLVDRPGEADIIVSNRNLPGKPVFHPKNLVVGVGCNRGTPATEFTEALDDLFSDLGLSILAVRNLASIDRKDDEEGLLAFAEQQNWPIDFYSKKEINRVACIETSQAALKAVGAVGVAEPCALLSAKSEILISRKRKWQNITMALAEAPFTLSAQVRAL